MDKQALVKEFLKKGVLISPSALQEMENGGGANAAQAAGSESCIVLGAERKGIRCTLKPAVDEIERITPADAAKAYRERFEKIRDMLLRKVDAVSIKNAARESAAVGVVGMVRESGDGCFVLEDTTGTINVKSASRVSQDDVVAVKGWMRDGALVAETVTYPDVPITREAGSANGILLLSTGVPAAGEFDVVITPDTLKDPSGERRLTPPSWAFIEDDAGSKISVFIHAYDGAVDRELALSWLRRRVIGDASCPSCGNAPVLDQVPDILWITGKNTPWTDNYKGVTMVSFGAGGRALVDLRTRDIRIMHDK